MLYSWCAIYWLCWYRYEFWLLRADKTVNLNEIILLQNDITRFPVASVSKTYFQIWLFIYLHIWCQCVCRSYSPTNSDNYTLRPSLISIPVPFCKQISHSSTTLVCNETWVTLKWTISVRDATHKASEWWHKQMVQTSRHTHN